MTKIQREFGAFFDAIYGYDPFPWQSMLAQQVIEDGWPDVIELPTAAGKTACIDIAVFALSHWATGDRKKDQPPRRIWFVVDRRIVVDEAFRRARHISEALQDAIDSKENPPLKSIAAALYELGMGTVDKKKLPLAVSRLRGGVPKELAWSGNPAQPVILTSTVDQIGSRLLFRGYGAGPRRWPMDAALVGNDSLIILDEAHCARPFMQTVSTVKQLQAQPFVEEPIGLPLRLTIMSATPPDDPPERKLIRFPRTKAERAEALDHELLRQRADASKRATLVLVKKNWKPLKGSGLIDALKGADEFVLAAAWHAATLKSGGCKRIAVMVNRVATARLIAEQLQHWLNDDAQVKLMIGRMRPLDRDVLVESLEKYLRSNKPEEPPNGKPIILVTTQCLEVGADYSFDGLVTECASLDALRQRFGRLDRLGDIGSTQAYILIREADEDPKKPDPIYNNALSATWKALKDASDDGVIDMGIKALGKHLKDAPANLNAPIRNAPILLPAYVDLLCQTNPQPAIEPDLSLFLHGMPKPGERPRPDVHVLWRADLLSGDESSWADRVNDHPPLSAEKLTLPLREFTQALRGETSADGFDIEGETEPDDRDRRDSGAESHSYVVYRAGRAMSRKMAGALRPDDTIVLPATSGLLANYIPPSSTPDLYELAFAQARDAINIRLLPVVLRQWCNEAQINCVASSLHEQTDEIVRELLDLLHVSNGDSNGLHARWNQMLDAPLSPRLINEAGDALALVSKRKREAPIEWDVDDEDELLTDTQASLYLLDHLRCVQRSAEHLANADRAMIHAALGQVVVRAAALHDLGKADERMQRYLGGQFRAVPPEKLLAKSGRAYLPSHERKRRESAGLPEGFRHEVLSMQMIGSCLNEDDEHTNLLLHLIASHHGFCRCFPLFVNDEQPPSVTLQINGEAWTIDADRRRSDDAGPLSAEVANRFWILTRRYGWWGLAYLELLVRSSDQYASSLGPTS